MAGQNGLLFSKVPRHRSAVYLRIEQSSQLKQEFFIIFQCPLDGEQFKAGGFMVCRQQPQRHESYRGITSSPHALSSGPSDPMVETQLTLREILILRVLRYPQLMQNLHKLEFRTIRRFYRHFYQVRRKTPAFRHGDISRQGLFSPIRTFV